MTIPAGSRIGPYEVVSALGAGGMGEVYRARDARLHREVALKILPAALAGDPAHVERFRREARAVAALSHPNVVTIHSVEEADGRHFLTMELISRPPTSAALYTCTTTNHLPWCSHGAEHQECRCGAAGGRRDHARGRRVQEDRRPASVNHRAV